LTWWTLILVIVGFGLVTVSDMLAEPSAVPVRAGLVLAILLVIGVSGRLYHASLYGWSGGNRAALPWYVAVGGLVCGAMILQSNADWPWLLLPATLTSAVVVGSGWPRWRVAGAGATLSAVLVMLDGWVAGSVNWRSVGVAVAVTLALTGSVLVQVWLWEVTARVDRARQAEGELAVSGERQRFAAELHDIQGHTLQAIVLKSELAARLVDANPAGAAEQMREVEALARQALRDTHEVVEGYRTVSLDTEINNATRVLAAAGIDCRTRHQPDPADLSERDERLLGLVVREGTTNVIRHSRARRAEIALIATTDEVRLRFHNDAPLAAQPDPDRATNGGLVGLANRFQAVGGTLTWQAVADGFTVLASLPAGAR
jgi:two-component system sensor histidine kinase DesK